MKTLPAVLALFLTNTSAIKLKQKEMNMADEAMDMEQANEMDMELDDYMSDPPVTAAADMPVTAAADMPSTAAGTADPPAMASAAGSKPPLDPAQQKAKEII